MGASCRKPPLSGRESPPRNADLLRDGDATIEDTSATRRSCPRRLHRRSPSQVDLRQEKGRYVRWRPHPLAPTMFASDSAVVRLPAPLGLRATHARPRTKRPLELTRGPPPATVGAPLRLPRATTVRTWSPCAAELCRARHARSENLGTKNRTSDNGRRRPLSATLTPSGLAHCHATPADTPSLTVIFGAYCRMADVTCFFQCLGRGTLGGCFWGMAGGSAWRGVRTLREAAIVTRGTACASRCLRLENSHRSFSGSGVDIIGLLFASSPAWIRHDDTRH